MVDERSPATQAADEMNVKKAAYAPEFAFGKAEGFRQGRELYFPRGVILGLFCGAAMATACFLFLGNKKDVTQKAAPKTEQVQKISTISTMRLSN